MKKTKINKCLCLLLVTVCSILFIISLNDFAVYADGSTKVIAHIETSQAETTDDSESSVVQNESNAETGDTIYADVIIILFLIVIAQLVIFFCNDKHGLKKEKQND